MSIKLSNVGVRYMVGDFKNLGLKDVVLQKIKKQYHAKEFWAVEDVSFEIEQGDFLGIVGNNGAGKSTLLKTIAGIMQPSKGTIKAEGNIAALLELGAGFDGDLTVKENTYLRGALMGYSKNFMIQTYPDIIKFSELEEFEDRPFRQLSSGMKSRLAFSIACLVEPEILILDEVLSVGDGSFRVKSEERMKKIINDGATTLYVSHSMIQMKTLCNKVLWLNKGKQMAFGNANTVLEKYEEFLKFNKSQ